MNNTVKKLIKKWRQSSPIRRNMLKWLLHDFINLFIVWQVPNEYMALLNPTWLVKSNDAKIGLDVLRTKLMKNQAIFECSHHCGWKINWKTASRDVCKLKVLTELFTTLVYHTLGRWRTFSSFIKGGYFPAKATLKKKCIGFQRIDSRWLKNPHY